MCRSSRLQEHATSCETLCPEIIRALRARPEEFVAEAFLLWLSRSPNGAPANCVEQVNTEDKHASSLGHIPFFAFRNTKVIRTSFVS